MKLFIAEKPSVARAIVQELGKIKSYEPKSRTINTS